MRRAWARLAWNAAGLVTALLAACTVGPDYRRPPAPTPASYKEAEGWKIGEPQDLAARGPWWLVYDDPLLDRLERQVDISNQNLKAAEAAFRQASAVVSAARATLFPILTLGASGTRSGIGGGGGGGGRGVVGSGGVVVVGGGGGGIVQNQFDLSAGASWDLDVWGRIRRTIESDVAGAQVSAADLAAARLSAQAALATDYLELRVADELKRLLDTTVVAYARSLEITRNRYAAGAAAQTDVVAARTQLEQTQAQAINVGVLRAQLEHAIAVLIGQPPAEFSIPPSPERLAARVPVTPPGLPSTLLERRPDIAAAERAMASSNALIGVAEAAFFPDVTLSASYGYASSALDNLLRASNSLWSFGPTIAETVFDAGLRAAQVAQARASYDQTVAGYRQTVLTGFQQVEDQLAALRILEQQAQVEDATVRDAEEAVRLTLNQYKAGTVDYTSVITAQAIALGNEETALGILQSRLVASISLIGALGGGWNASDLPTAAEITTGKAADATQ